ncbi:Oxygen-independent coproporphyrinogen-III oxidase-like protein YqeR [bioreactor metagenome]|uniref:Oxygen-independent coproporphyrinogen-III oxidase-like protein YqeR n=1 Tax=bioreactor metagenome TaxID=1076179 RepID=A0A645C5Q7_9ZZZZ|nr:radical SAM family heme chaperone HemW [Paludibacter sp.]
MAGIYLHIPFCKQRCTYCDFYKEIAPEHVDELVNTLITELRLRKDYLKGQSISTIYFGGGTPSILNYSQFKKIFDEIFILFNVVKHPEITMEANPDDLTEKYLQSLSPLPFNRISIGIQSFDDEYLIKINRRHTSQQAIEAVKNARNAGFDNISIDLIYALPGQTLDNWRKQLEKAFALNVEHISAYGLTYEKGTELWRQRNKGLLAVVEDEVTIQMYNYMLLKMNENNYDTYEISNFSKSGYRSQHNSAYWKFIPYLGIGPSAHSFDGNSRQWNIASVKKYMERIASGDIYYEKEILSTQDSYNDYIMVALRTAEGIYLNNVKDKFGNVYLTDCLKNAAVYIKSKDLIMEDERLYLSQKGIHISNLIIMELMKTD